MPVCNNKIDIHAHAIRTTFTDFDICHLPSPESVLARYDQFGIEKGMLLPLVSAEARNLMSTTEQVMEIVKEYPNRFFFAMGLDPRMMGHSTTADFGKLIEAYKALGAKAVGEVTGNLYFDDPYYDNMFAQCAEHAIPVTIHISPELHWSYGIVDEPGLYRLEKMLKKYPKLKIFGHSTALWAHMSAGTTVEDMKRYPEPGKIQKGRLWELFEKYDNLYGDLSANSAFFALTRDEEKGLDFLNTFRDKMMFGCDFCAPWDTSRLAMWLDEKYTEGALSEEVYWKVCRENAVRILQLAESFP